MRRAIPQRRSATGPDPRSDGYDNRTEALLAVHCGESTNPSSPAVWPLLARLADVRSPYFGADWTYLSQPCATWPVRDADAFTGSYTATTSPVLFVNGRFDAASDYAQATTAAAAMPGARLLTVDGPGHPASFIPNTCLQDAESAYLIDGRLPPAGTVCVPDNAPFQ